MAITQGMCTSFKVQLLNGVHNFSADTFKMALYTSSATIGESTTAYSATNEASGANYTAGGNIIYVDVQPTSGGNTAYVSFSNTTWTTATITAAGAMIYNNSKSNAAVCVLNFGGDKTSTAGNFSVNFPTADATSAIIRLTAS